MSDRKKDFLAAVLTGAVIAVAVFLLGRSREYDLPRCVCDALFIPGVLLFCLGILKEVRNRGVFDIMGYGTKSTIEVFLPFLRSGEKEDIYAYRERKAGERKPARGLILAGVWYLVLSVLALVVYYQV